MARRSRRRGRRIRRIPFAYLIIIALALGIISILIYVIPGRYRLYQTTLYDPLEEAAENPLMGFAPDARRSQDCQATKLVTIHLSWEDWEPEKGEYDKDNLEKQFHLEEYKTDNKHGVLRFDGKSSYKADASDKKEAIKALGKYFSKDSFISYVELDEEDLEYIDTYKEAFPHALMLAPADYNGEEGTTGLYFDKIGDAKKKKDKGRHSGQKSWKQEPNAGSLTKNKKKKDLLNKDLSQVLAQIRDNHITYISGKCPDAEEQKSNGSRMISQTLGYCIYISRMQTVLDFRKDEVNLRFTFKNTGVAPAYIDWPVVMSVYSHNGDKLHEVELPMELKQVVPGEDFEVVGAFPYSKRLNKGFSIGIHINNQENPEDYITLSQKETKPDSIGEHIIYKYEPEKSGKKVQIARPADYQTAMIMLIADMSDYAKNINPDFSMITNGGYKLYMPNYNTSEEYRTRLYSTMDGMIVESIFYGWEGRMNSKTPDSMTKEMLSAVNSAKEAGLAAFNIEYCNEKNIQMKSSEKSREAGSVWFNAEDMELSQIPKLNDVRESRGNCKKAEDAKNFLTMLNPIDYPSKSAYLKALRNTNYDVLFIDLYYQGEQLTRKDIASLKTKKNGGKRMVCAYLSVGEAEDYRDYWQKSWDDNPPPWISEMNKEWEGDYKVMYWTKSWRDILFGSKDSYLDKIISAGFDGAYLDVVDAYEYFEEE
jgi:cysteinyl-tRNA synthetase